MAQEDRSRQEQEREEKIRARAHRMWLEEGQPEGRAHEHWERARILVEIEEAGDVGRIPLPKDANAGPWGDPVEPAVAFENQGEFPTVVDQGEEQAPRLPKRRKGRGG
jgi:hypothetical protein